MLKADFLIKMKKQSKYYAVVLQILNLRIMILKIQVLSGHILLIWTKHQEKA